MNPFRKRLTAAVMVAAGALYATAASATPYVITLTQQGNNVVAISSGSIDLAGTQSANNLATACGGVIAANQGVIGIGPPALDPNAATCNFYSFASISGPSTFGPGTSNFLAEIPSTGSGVAVTFAASGLSQPLLLLYSQYISDTPMSGSTIWDNDSFANMGVTPGTYVWKWGTGADQSITLDVISPASINATEPAALGLFGFGLLLLGAFVGLRRRMA